METLEAQLKIMQLISTSYDRARLKNKSYSIRAFAKKLGIASPVMIQVMNGKRTITKKFAQKILPQLLDDSNQIHHLLNHLKNKNRASNPSIPQVHSQYSELNAAEYNVVSDWAYFAMISFMETKSFNSDLSWISKRLGINKKKCTKILKELSLLNLVTEKNGKYQSTRKSFTTTQDVTSLQIQKNHIQGLDLAAEALHLPVEERDFSSVTLALDPQQMNKFKKLIENFRRSITDEMEMTRSKEVYRFQIQLFPLTKKINH